MPPKLQEITATYQRERPNCRWGETCFIEVWPREQPQAVPLVVKLDCLPDELLEGIPYKFRGRWDDNSRYGRQFLASDFWELAPTDRIGIITYLTQHAVGCNGIGTAKAKALFEYYGEEAIHKLKKDPETCFGLLKSLPHNQSLKLESVKAWSDKINKSHDVESAMLNLIGLLAGKGFYRSVPRDVIRLRGNRGAAEVRRDPYKLMTWRIRGCSFDRCDALYSELGLPPWKLKRQTLAAWYAVTKAKGGNTWCPMSIAEKGISGSISGVADERIKPERAIQVGIRAGYLAETWTDGATGPVVAGESGRGNCRWVAWGKKAENERELAELVVQLSGGEAKWQNAPIV